MRQNSAVRGSPKKDHPGLFDDHIANPLAKHGETLTFQFNNNVYIRMFHQVTSVEYIILKQNYLNVMGQYIPEIFKILVIVGTSVV